VGHVGLGAPRLGHLDRHECAGPLGWWLCERACACGPTMHWHISESTPAGADAEGARSQPEHAFAHEHFILAQFDRFKH
jgi:hypothetical protein